ncbi:hypothetical protein JAAARDRAFT_171107 [Jaapia argillacea MUCL 33604]|uniref:Uncharacterized protein n=1 Tax=Jaapia argillacea MUCL 33604 TaxID=933084 RepID=A0A067Q6C5_9AGAM|nr:hypothetical protein JAAARDRAFT_171107 [Jaapia argillacea MUCL 33604]
MPRNNPATLGPTEQLTSRVSHRARSDAAANLLNQGFPYSKKLSSHTSCVNALVFSSGEGRWLASAGDDLRVLLWDFHQEDISRPSAMFLGPRSNVFAVAFSAHNQYLLAGGTDDSIYRYDLSHSPTGLGRPLDVVERHNDNVRAVSCHPVQDEIFMSASEDGSIMLHDMRAGSTLTNAQGTLQNDCEFTDVKCHPTMEHIFATSDNHGKVTLRDTRMAFGPRSSRTKDGIVQKYNTTLSKQSASQLCNPEVSNLSFDKDGRKLGVLMLHYLPTIYSLSDPQPLATCSGRNLSSGIPVPPGVRTYSNSCTIKHGTFSDSIYDNDQFYTTGSDDFRGYVWKIPDLGKLVDSREEISFDEWIQRPNTIAFASKTWEPRYIPQELSTPFCTVNGHKSIVNSAIMHPHFLHLVTSGIERHIVLHSVTASSPCVEGLLPTPSDVRMLPDVNEEDHRRFIHALTTGHSTISEDQDEIDDDTIALFDEILRQEGNADPFTVRIWGGGSDSDSGGVDVDDSDGSDWS